MQKVSVLARGVATLCDHGHAEEGERFSTPSASGGRRTGDQFKGRALGQAERRRDALDRLYRYDERVATRVRARRRARYGHQSHLRMRSSIRIAQV